MNNSKNNTHETILQERIKTLQKDRQFMFKMTEDVIDMVYRIAYSDFSKVLHHQLDDSKDFVGTSNDMINKYGNQVSFKKLKEDYDEALNEISELKAKVIKLEGEREKRFGSKRDSNTYGKYDVEEQMLKAKQEAYAEILKYIEDHSDLMDVYIYVKDKSKTERPYVRRSYP